jgi:hypothetical protein
VEDSDAKNTDHVRWGRRLSENKLRTFDWISECIELAGMKSRGETTATLAKLFGYNPAYIGHVVAVGNLPGLEKLAVIHDVKRAKNGNPSDTSPLLSFMKARDLLLPLRVWPSNIPKENIDIDFSLFDYSRVTECIDLLVSGKLSVDDLPEIFSEISGA